MSLALIFQGMQWYFYNSNSIMSLEASFLLLSGIISLCLAIFARNTESTVAASIISLAWMSTAGVIFYKGLNAPTEAATLFATSVAQFILLVFSQLTIRGRIRAQHNEYVEGTHISQRNIDFYLSRNNANQPQYGALSSFVDPINLNNNKIASSPPQKGTTSPAPRTPSPSLLSSNNNSPFGGNASSNTSSPVKVQTTMSAAAMETPDVVRASYKALLSKYELDS